MSTSHGQARRRTNEHALRILRIALPVIVAAAGTAIWEGVVRIYDIQPYVLPGPLAVIRTPDH